MKNALHVVMVIVIGSLMGIFIGKVCGIWFPPTSQVSSLLSIGIDTGLRPTTIDLNLIEFTFGMVFKLNMASIAGIFLSAVIYKQLIKQ